jgi:hypothetical protein
MPPNAIRLIHDEADEYFRRLGGSGRYDGFRDWHIPALTLLVVTGLDPDSHEFLLSRESHSISPRLWRETDDLPSRLAARARSLTFSQLEFETYLRFSFEFVATTSARECLEWSRFLSDNGDRFRKHL